MQSVSSRIWTRVTVSISYDDNHYTTGTSIYHYQYSFANTTAKLIGFCICIVFQRFQYRYNYSLFPYFNWFLPSELVIRSPIYSCFIFNEITFERSFHSPRNYFTEESLIFFIIDCLLSAGLCGGKSTLYPFVNICFRLKHGYSGTSLILQKIYLFNTSQPFDVKPLFRPGTYSLI